MLDLLLSTVAAARRETAEHEVSAERGAADVAHPVPRDARAVRGHSGLASRAAWAPTVGDIVRVAALPAVLAGR